MAAVKMTYYNLNIYNQKKKIQFHYKIQNKQNDQDRYNLISHH